MKFYKYKGFGEFVTESQSWLEEQEAFNNKIIATLVSLKSSIKKSQEEEGPKTAFYGNVLHDNKIINCAFIANKGLFCSGQANLESLNIISQNIMESQIQINRIFAASEIANILHSNISKEQSLILDKKMQTVVMQIREIPQVEYPEGIFRSANSNDEILLSTYMELFFLESFGSADPEWSNKKVKKLIETDSLFLLEVQGTIVSMAAIVRRLSKGMAISYVFTPKAHRGQGFASKCTGKLTAYILSNKMEYAVLFADKKNKQSQKIYSKLGYQVIGEFCDIEYESVL